MQIETLAWLNSSVWKRAPCLHTCERSHLEAAQDKLVFLSPISSFTGAASGRDVTVMICSRTRWQLSLTKTAQISPPDGAALHLCAICVVKLSLLREKTEMGPKSIDPSIHPSESGHGGCSIGRGAQTSPSPDTSSSSSGSSWGVPSSAERRTHSSMSRVFPGASSQQDSTLSPYRMTECLTLPLR